MKSKILWRKRIPFEREKNKERSIWRVRSTPNAPLFPPFSPLSFQLPFFSRRAAFPSLPFPTLPSPFPSASPPILSHRSLLFLPWSSIFVPVITDPHPHPHRLLRCSFFLLGLRRCSFFLLGLRLLIVYLSKGFQVWISCQLVFFLFVCTHYDFLCLDFFDFGMIYVIFIFCLCVYSVWIFRLERLKIFSVFFFLMI